MAKAVLWLSHAYPRKHTCICTSGIGLLTCSRVCMHVCPAKAMIPRCNQNGHPHPDRRTRGVAFWLMTTVQPHPCKTPARLCSSEAWCSAVWTRSRALRLDICMTRASTWLRSLLLHRRNASRLCSSCCVEKLRCKCMHPLLLATHVHI